MSKQPVKRTFYALANGRVDGQRVVAGQPVELTDHQAQYEPVTTEPPQPPKAAKARKSTAEATPKK